MLELFLALPLLRTIKGKQFEVLKFLPDVTVFQQLSDRAESLAVMVFAGVVGHAHKSKYGVACKNLPHVLKIVTTSESIERIFVGIG